MNAPIRFLSMLLPPFMLLAFTAGAQVVVPGEQARLLAPGLGFGEGPATDAEGNVFFTDQPNDRILKWSVNGELSTFKAPSGRANGLCFDGDGNLWACADEKSELWKIEPAGKVEVVVKDYEGKLLNGPNDVWVRPDGGVYFTDPFYQRPYWQRGPMEQDAPCVYYLSPNRRQLTRVADGFERPNGVIGTPDGKLLYVADIGAQKTYRYNIQPDGALTERTLFCEMGSDGMTIDDQGNVYLTKLGVTVFDPSGKEIERIELPEPNRTTNVCFGGKDRRTLFITAPSALYAIRMAVAGVGSQ
jgi:gluconolactonase